MINPQLKASFAEGGNETYGVFYDTLMKKYPLFIVITQIENDGEKLRHRYDWASPLWLAFVKAADIEIPLEHRCYFKSLMHHSDAVPLSSFCMEANDMSIAFSYLKIRSTDNKYHWLCFCSRAIAYDSYGHTSKVMHLAFDVLDPRFIQVFPEAAWKEMCQQLYAEKIKEISLREREILKMVAKGYTDKEIANELFISTRTAETHRNNLLKKTNARNTAALVSFAHKVGLY